MKKRLLSLAIVVALTAACASAPVGGAYLPTANAAGITTGYEIQDGVLLRYESNESTIVIPSSVTSISNKAFGSGSVNYAATGITIPASVTEIEDPWVLFVGFSKLTEINVDSKNPNYASKDGVLFNKDLTKLIYCPLGKSGSYEIPDTVTEIGPRAFEYHYDITGVTIPTSVTSIGELAFSESGLTAVTIPKSVTSIGENALKNCDNLKTITVSSKNTQYASSGGVLFDKDLTVLLDCPEGKSGSYEIPHTVTRIGKSALAYCNKLTAVTIPDSVTVIGENAFQSCYGLTKVTIPGSVTSIGNYAFANCDLHSMILYNSVATVGNAAFYGNDLKNVYYIGSKDEWKKIKIGSQNDALTGAAIHYGSESARPTVTAQPADVVAKSGEKVSFKVTATGDGLTYQWQLSDDQGKTWRNSSTKTANYSTTLSSTNDGRYVRCIVTDGYGMSVASQAASMSILGTELKITTQPVSMVAKSGATVTFQVAATGDGLTYQWQLSDDAGKNWRNSSIKTATYATTLSSKNNGRYVRCVITDKRGNQVISDAAVMTMSGVTITTHPANVSAKSGATVTFKVVATGTGLTYQWQLSDDEGKTWRNSSVKTATYATTLSSKNDGRYVRCIVTDGYGSKAVSRAAGMTLVAADLKITAQPVSVSVKKGATAAFKVKATGDGLTYQWQLSDDQGKTWRNSKATSANYSATVTDSNNGRYVRCVIKDQYGNSVTSNAASMTIANAGLEITTQPANVTAGSGAAVSFKVAATGEGLTYQWQLSDDQGKNWRNSSLKTANYATTLSDKNNGRYVRCIVTDKYGNQVISNAASMTITTTQLKIITQPVSVTDSKGETVAFQVRAAGDGLTYQWQLSDDAGKTWRNSKATGSFYSATLTDSNNGRYVRCIIKDKYGNSVTSNAASMKAQ